MRANEFITEGWYDDAKAKVKQSLPKPGITGRAASQASNLASKVGPGLKTAYNAYSNAYDNVAGKVNKAKQAVSNIPLVGNSTVGSAAKAVGSAAKSDASAIAQGGVNAIKGVGRAFGLGGATARADMSTQNFTKKFKETIKATQARQAQLGEPFDLATFSNSYLSKYGWKPGQLQTQLSAAVKSNNINQLAVVMDKIGSLNSVDPEAKGNEIDMTPKLTTPTTPAAPAMKFGGEQQDPNDPATARLMAMAKQQGKI